jgi:UDP-N-acetylenolpyruvoylglucosamine reductase
MTNIKIEKNKALYPYLTLKTKTAAEFYFEAKTKEDLVNAKIFSLENKIPLIIIGGGSNVAIFKEFIKGLVVRNLYQKKEIINETADSVDLLVSSGYIVNLLVNETIEAGYQGFEYHLGLPGTVGGAIYMNSKWTKPLTYFGDNLIKADLVDKEGKIKTVKKDYFNFAYDTSVLQKSREILLEAVFRLKKEAISILKARALEAQQYRQRTQPIGVATCGCFFRNISASDKEKHQLPTTSVGYLIDKAGLKGIRRGGFMVSDKHANFIINVEKDKSNLRDLYELLKLIKDRIKEKYDIDLKEEVEFI